MFSISHVMLIRVLSDLFLLGVSFFFHYYVLFALMFLHVHNKRCIVFLKQKERENDALRMLKLCNIYILEILTADNFK